MYLREAKRAFNLKVYKCLLKIKDTERLEEIYFTESVMVGLFADAEIIRTNKLKSEEKVAKYENMNALEIIREKISRNTTLIADLAF